MPPITAGYAVNITGFTSGQRVQRFEFSDD